MQMIVVGPTKVVILDQVRIGHAIEARWFTLAFQVQHNALKKANGRPAWAVEYVYESLYCVKLSSSCFRWDTVTSTPRVLNPASNTFCAAGAHLGNGTFVSTGMLLAFVHYLLWCKFHLILSNRRQCAR
jgi:hypothetical protein